MDDYVLREQKRNEILSEAFAKFLDQVVKELLSFGLEEQNLFIIKVKGFVIEQRYRTIEEKSKELDFWKESTENLVSNLKS